MFSDNRNMLNPDDFCNAFAEVAALSNDGFAYKITLDKVIKIGKHLPTFKYENAEYMCISSSHDIGSTKTEYVIFEEKPALLKDNSHYVAEIKNTKTNHIINLIPIK